VANNFCRLLSNGYSVRTDGQELWYRPCCWFNQEINFNDPNFVSKQKDIGEISGWTNSCNRCRQIEASGMYGSQSPRLRSFDAIPDADVPNGIPVEIELSIDLTCNAACLSCGPWSSTTWIKQYIKYDIKSVDDIPDLEPSDRWLQEIKTLGPLTHVRSISFLGGEPFKSPVPAKFLKLINSTVGLEHVRVHFQSNASIVPSPELIKLLRVCRKVVYGLSIDGIGERFNYLRYPLQWNKVIKTLDHVKSLELDNLQFSIVYTANPLNVYYYQETEIWAQNFFKNYIPTDNPDYCLILPNRCSGNLDLRFIPTALKDKTLADYGADHPVSKMLIGLTSNHSQDPDPMLQYLNKWDLLRKKNWSQIFPEVAEYFESD
jgi:hypothetical protein